MKTQQGYSQFVIVIVCIIICCFALVVLLLFTVGVAVGVAVCCHFFGYMYCFFRDNKSHFGIHKLQFQISLVVL